MKLLPCPNECGVAILQKLGEGGAEETIDTPTFQAIRGEPPLPPPPPPPPPPISHMVGSINDALLPPPPPPPGVFHQRALDHDPHHMQLHCTFLLSDGKWCKVSCSQLKKLMVCFSIGTMEKQIITSHVIILGKMSQLTLHPFPSEQ